MADEAPERPSILAIIGSAGRHDDASRLSPELYMAMLERVRGAIAAWQIAELTSGGAAFSDHLAVSAFLKGWCPRLTLMLPARWEGTQFQDSRDGGVTNHWHRKFSESCGLDSLKELGMAIDAGAEVRYGSDFKDRNIAIGRHATHMLAFTFGTGLRDRVFKNGSEGFGKATSAGLKPKSGTMHAWNHAPGVAIKAHIDLGCMVERLNAVCRSGFNL